MAWPNSRLTTYVDGVTPIKASDLNAIQDALISDLITARAWSVPFASFQPSSAGLTQPAAATGWVHGTATGRLMMPLQPLAVGDVIASWSVFVNKTSTSGTLNAALYAHTLATGALVQVGATASNSANNPGNIVLTDAPAHVVLAGTTYYVDLVLSGITGDTTKGGRFNTIPYRP